MKLHSFALLLCLLASISSSMAQNTMTQNQLLIQRLQEYTQERYPNVSFTKAFLYVSLETQCMYWIENWQIQRMFVISGAETGAGNQGGSNQTPTGLHHISEKFGDDVPLGGILKSRAYTGKVAQIHTDQTNVKEDHVTTRILWLSGDEAGINKGGKVDSHGRYIYIHGTPEEGLLGRPASHGCIRMFNQEVIELYDEANIGMKVLILDE